MQTSLHSHGPLLFFHRFKVEKGFCAQVQLLESEKNKKTWDLYISHNYLCLPPFPFSETLGEKGMGKEGNFYRIALLTQVISKDKQLSFSKDPL